MAVSITVERCRTVLVELADRVLNHRLLSWLSSEQNAVLMACRATVISDDSVVQKIVGNVGPYSADQQPQPSVVEGEVMAVVFAPARPDGLVTMWLRIPDGKEEVVWVFANDPTTTVKVAGALTPYSDAVSWMVRNACTAKITLTSGVLASDVEINPTGRCG
jgi:hypothetical protein